MRTIIHISDMHFGKIDAESTDSLVHAFGRLKPDLVVISGDLTQRAKVSEFESAKIFLEHLNKEGIKYFVVPGNHDLEPFYKPFARALDPYKTYKKYIGEDLAPHYSDGELAVAGVDTARNFNLKDGNISKAQVKKIEKWFSQFTPKVFKMVVSHHPFDLPINNHSRKLVRRAHHGVTTLSSHSVDLYVSGHYHQSSIITTEERYDKLGYKAIAAQAGTLSRRQRGEVQSFNVIEINMPNLSISTYLWDSESKLFKKNTIKHFKQSTAGWKKV